MKPGCLLWLLAIVVATGLVLAPLACAPKHAPPPPVTEASHDWYNYDLATKGWTEGEPGWKHKKTVPATGYTEGQKHMILLRKPKVSTRRHEKDLISEMIWAREKQRNK